MSETTNQDQAAAASNHQYREIHLRIWPALVIVLAQFSLAFGISLLGSTAIQRAAAFTVVPSVAALLLIIWWLAASRAPIRDRLIGLALFAATLVWAVFTQKEWFEGVVFLIIAVPALTTGAVAFLAATFWLRWPLRRWIVAALMVICAGTFTAIRVDGMSGTLMPISSWRWTPTTDDLSTGLPPLKGGETALLPAQAGPGDWPGFRGPARDSHAAGTRFSTDWSTPPREMWRRRVGVGWSSFAVIGDYVFTQEQRGGEELVTCYRAETGEDVWVNSVDAQREDVMGEGPRATPTFDRGRLYTLGATGILQCLDAATGNTIWKRSLTTDVGAEIPDYGFSSSPLVAGELVVVFTGGGEGKSVAAYDRASGDVAWCAGHASAGYSSPHLASIGQVPQVVMNSDFGVQSFEPETGTLLWEHSWTAKGTPRVVQPLFIDPGSVLLGATGNMGTRLLKIEKQDKTWSVKEEWTTRKLRPYFNDFVVHKGHCYGFDGDRLACINAMTGKPQWEGKHYGGQLLLMSDMDMLLVLSETGDVVLIPAAPEGFSEIASFKAITGKTWNHPVVAHGKLFVRNAEEAACFELGTTP